ncbi:hypothetical protein [Aquabacterium sp. OR-4]|uniref:hypothetical protein n=1 Tax=Aquabacterium sp. OR-4 TaxID=2978127 RepID=UPI0021B3CCC4|nr:hypothetical protein [Aquabacterium sp. OR-4]MDT7837883.1 hypothetical protein [Aquabacterium sp. OR-4]
MKNLAKLSALLIAVGLLTQAQARELPVSATPSMKCVSVVTPDGAYIKCFRNTK